MNTKQKGNRVVGYFESKANDPQGKKALEDVGKGAALFFKDTAGIKDEKTLREPDVWIRVEEVKTMDEPEQQVIKKKPKDMIDSIGDYLLNGDMDDLD